MEKYANHVDSLTEEREAFSHGCEKENQQLRHEVKALPLKQGNFSFCKNVKLIFFLILKVICVNYRKLENVWKEQEGAKLLYILYSKKSTYNDLSAFAVWSF